MYNSFADIWHGIETQYVQEYQCIYLINVITNNCDQICDQICACLTELITTPSVTPMCTLKWLCAVIDDVLSQCQQC